jgi:hypothetical protein
MTEPRAHQDAACPTASREQTAGAAPAVPASYSGISRSEASLAHVRVDVSSLNWPAAPGRRPLSPAVIGGVSGA